MSVFEIIISSVMIVMMLTLAYVAAFYVQHNVPVPPPARGWKVIADKVAAYNLDNILSGVVALVLMASTLFIFVVVLLALVLSYAMLCMITYHLVKSYFLALPIDAAVILVVYQLVKSVKEPVK